MWGEAARHVVWLMNRTLTKAVEGKTPYEAALGVKPDLSGVREWGEKCWVRVEKGSKLGGRVREGRWVGVDDESKGVRVYWPDTKTVSVERNVYFDPLFHPPFPRPPQLLPCLLMDPQPLLKPLLKANLRRMNPVRGVLENPVNACSKYFPGAL